MGKWQQLTILGFKCHFSDMLELCKEYIKIHDWAERNGYSLRYTDPTFERNTADVTIRLHERAIKGQPPSMSMEAANEEVMTLFKLEFASE